MCGSDVEKVAETTLDVGLQTSTGGLVGYEDGGLKAGIVGEKVVGGLKEITGAAAAEEANVLARQRFEEERQRELDIRQQQQEQTAAEQMTKSLAAGGRTGTTDRTGRSSLFRYSSIGRGERDFLGL